MANFARHSYGTDWIPKYSENMWRMKKEDIERRRNAFGEQLKADTAMGTTLSPERQARADKEWGPGSGASFQRQSEYHKGQADAEKAEKDAENKAKLEQTALNQQVKVTDMGIKFVNMAVTTLNNGGMDGPAQDMFNRAQELLKKGGTEVDFSNILNSKEAKDKLSNGLMKTFTDILGKTDQDLTQANIRKVQAAYKKAEIGKVPGIENYSSVVQNLNTKLAAQKKQKQTENAAKAKRAQGMEAAKVKREQGMEDFKIKERFKQQNAQPKTVIDLTRKALAGDKESKQILGTMAAEKIASSEAIGEATAKGKVAGLLSVMDITGTVKAIREGRETIENVKNTFGIPIQEAMRKGVLAEEPGFNFVQPRAILASLTSSLRQQQKNRGSMGSFVKNISGQVNKIKGIADKMVKRAGLRAINVPYRELVTRFKGSGHENVFKAYMLEISREIDKLAQGSTGSVALGSVENQKLWDKVHDVNLSTKDLMIVLEGTKEMANVRLKSVDDELTETIKRMKNVRSNTTTSSNNGGTDEDPLGIR